MSPVVGVPKREPCQKCGNPVFLAERLIIGRALYHRTCLRCARCNSQLTLGSFYETEMDGVFCCETCPDEETIMKRNEQWDIAGGSSSQDMVDDYIQMDPTRKSFSEKLAMFQTNDKSLLQKSLSDEEKSKSLQRLSEMYARNGIMNSNDDVSTTKSNAVAVAIVEKPTNFEVDNDERDDENKFDSSSDSEMECVKPSTILESHEKIESNPIEMIETSQAPPIPLKPPPIASKANVLNKIYGISIVPPLPIKSTQHTVSVHENDIEKLCDLSIELTDEMQNTNRNEETLTSQTQPSIANSTSNLVDNSNSKISSPNGFHAIDSSNTMPSNHHNYHQQQQQQETISNATKDETANCNESVQINEVADDDANVIEIIRNDSINIETENKAISDTIGSHLETDAHVDLNAYESSDNGLASKNDQIELEIPANAENEQNATEQDDAIVMIPSKPVPVKRATIPVESINDDIQPPTPMRRKHLSTVRLDDDLSLSMTNERNSIESTTSTDKISSNASTKKSKEYPVELNPFGDSEDENENIPSVSVRVTTASKLDNSNPFDSSDDEVELLKETPRKVTERKSSAIR